MDTGSGQLAARRAGPALGLALLLVAVSCGGDDPTDTEATTSPNTQQGPLAVAEFAGGDDALVTGTIRITDTCVQLAEGDVPALLVWPKERTSWDSEDASVEFVTRSGDRVEFRDGDKVTLAGGGSSVAENENTEEFLESVTWVSEPARECVVDVRWFVSDTATGNGG